MALTRPTIYNLNTNVEVFNDSLTVLNAGATAPNTDVGFIFNRAQGLVPNAAVYWSESLQSVMYALTNSSGATNSNVVVSSYANITVGNLLSINGNIFLNNTTGTPGQYITSTAAGTAWTSASYIGGPVSVNVYPTSNLTINSGGASNYWANTYTGNLIIANGIFYANGTVFSSGTGGGTYSNVAMLANLAATNNPITIGSNLTVGGNITTSGNLVAASINNTIIGNTGPVAGTFSTLAVNSTNIGLGSRTSPGTGAVSIGYNTSNNGQGPNSVAIGYNISQAGTQGSYSVAIGNNAGGFLQTGQSAVAIGNQAGFNQTASNAIAIGYLAGYWQSASSIVLNATGNNLNGNVPGFFVAPVRNDATTANIGNVVMYNTTTNEFTYSNAIAIAGTATVANLITTSGLFWANGAAYSSGSGAKSTSATTPPSSPAVGDIWYNTTTDDIYRWTTDGVSSYWLDITGATVANVPANLVGTTLTTSGNITVGGSLYVTSNAVAGTTTRVEYNIPHPFMLMGT
jgi:hypothetical protein